MADIELVIKLPEDDYKRIVKRGMTVFGSDEDIALLEEALENGTPLPKGHGALKDENEVFAVMERNFDMQDLYLPIHFKQFALDEAQTVIEANKEGNE